MCRGAPGTCAAVGAVLDPKERVKPESVVGAVLGRPKEVRSPPDGASSKKGITKTVVGTAQDPKDLVHIQLV